MDSLHFDYETFAEPDLPAVGLGNYLRCPHFEILMVAWAINREPVRLEFLTKGRRLSQDLLDHLRNPRVIKKAWNAQFERKVTERQYGLVIPAEQFECTQARAASLSLPGSLDQCGEIMRLSDEFRKDKDGKRLMDLFSKPRKPTKKNPHARCTEDTHPDEWQAYGRYCIRDVIAERKIDQLLCKFPIAANTWQVYAIDQRINDRGVPIDVQLVDNAIEMARRRKAELTAELRAITGLANPNSPAQLLPWLQERGYPFGNLQAARMKKALDDFSIFLDPAAVNALKLRRAAAKRSVDKFAAIKARVEPDGRARYCLQFAGAARTLRWAARGIQLHNPPRAKKEHEPYLDLLRKLIRAGDYEGLLALFDEPIDALASSVRSAVAAPPGRELRVADINAVETRLSGWLANSVALRRVFAAGLDPYKMFATVLYGVPYEQVTPAMRGIAKPAMLGCWYMLGGGDEVGEYPDTTKTGLWGYAENMGVMLSRDEAHRQVQLFRSTYNEARKAWYSLRDAVVECLETRQQTTALKAEFDICEPFLRMKLPSGRYIYYLRPRLRWVTVRRKDPKTGEVSEYLQAEISYEGRSETGGWTRIYTHPGKFFENCLSADSKVLTDCGPRRIVDVTKAMRVWDGAAFVSHAGVIYSGTRLTLNFGPGIRITPEHRVLVNSQWVEARHTSYEKAASEIEGSDRSSSGLFNCRFVRRLGREKFAMGNTLRLFTSIYHGGERIQKRAATILRMQTRAVNKQENFQTPNVIAPGVLGLAVNESAMRKPKDRSVWELRGARHKSLRRMDEIFFFFLGGCWQSIQTRIRDRQNRQRRKLRAGKRSMDNQKSKFKKQTIEYLYRYAARRYADMGRRRTIRNKQDNVDLSGERRHSGRTDVRFGGLEEPVFDIANSGPRNRFAVIGDDGRIIIVHNCVQAVARDDLAEDMLDAESQGFEIVMHLHDELVSEHDKDDDVHTHAALAALMSTTKKWAPGLLLAAAGYSSEFHRKD